MKQDRRWTWTFEACLPVTKISYETSYLNPESYVVFATVCTNYHQNWWFNTRGQGTWFKKTPMTSDHLKSNTHRSNIQPPSSPLALSAGWCSARVPSTPQSCPRLGQPGGMAYSEQWDDITPWLANGLVYYVLLLGFPHYTMIAEYSWGLAIQLL